MKKLLVSLLLLVAPLFPQATPPGQTTNPVQKVNVQWVNGISPGYWAKKTTGLNLAIGAGVVNCDGVISTYSGDTIAVTDNATSYGFLNSATSCTPTLSTVQPSCGQFLFAKVIASGGQITSIVDMRMASTYCAGAIGHVGGGAPGSLSLTPGTIDFGSVQSGETSFPVNLILSNTGDASVAVTDAELSGDPFSSPSLNICNTQINGGASCSLPLTCAPSTVGSVDGSVTITSTAPVDSENPLVVPLHCTGTSGVTYPLSLNFAGTGSGTCVTDETPTPLINATWDGSSISGRFSNNYVSGATPILTCTPRSDSTLASLTEGGVSCLSPCMVTVSAAKQATAIFNLIPQNFTLNIAGIGPGTATLTSDKSDVVTGQTLNCKSAAGVVSSGGGAGCSAGFAQGTVVRVTEVPDGSSTFVSWSGIPGCTTEAFCDITMDALNTVTVNITLTSAPISLMQTMTNCSVASTTIACTWANAMNVGDFLICAVDIPDATTTVSSMADTKGNTYTEVPTISPKVGTNITQALYYSQNIAAATAGSNVTTMTLSGAVAPIVGTNLTTYGDATPANNIVTSSVTCTTNNLILIGVWAFLASGNGPGPISTVTGCGITWVNVTNVSFGSTFGSGQGESLELWRGLGTGSSGAITVNWATSPTQHYATVSKFSGVDLTGTFGSGAIGITASHGTTGATSPATVTMGTFGSAANGTYGVMGIPSVQIPTVGSGMTILGARNDMADEYAAGNVSPVQMVFGAGSFSTGIIGVEIKVPQNRRDLRCAEYAGILTGGSPIDVSAAAVGTSATAAPGTMTPGTTGDLLTNFTVSDNSVQTGSANFTQRIKNSFGDTLEDVEGANTSAYNPSDTLTSSGNWISSQIAWKPSGTPGPTNYSLTIAAGVGSNGNGVVTSDTGTPVLNCMFVGSTTTNVCSSSIIPNSRVTMTATPQVGSVFAGWSGVNGCGASAICTIPNITANANIIANFTLSGQLAYYIATTGSDSNPCTSSSPCLTINSVDARLRGTSPALPLGATGTVIHVAAGTYSAAVTTHVEGSASARVTWISDTPLGAKLLNGWLAMNVGWTTVAGGDYNDIIGFDITNPNADTGVELGQVQCVNHVCGGNGGGFNYGRLLNNYVHDVGTYGTTGPSGSCAHNAAIGVSVLTHDVLIDGNRVNRAGIYGGCAGGTSDHGIYVSGYHNTTTNNLVSNVAGDGYTNNHNPCENVFANNTVFHNFTGGAVIGNPNDNVPPCAAFGTNDYGSVNNNIFVRNGWGGTYSVPSTHGCFAVSYLASGTHNTQFNNLLAGNLDCSGANTTASNTTSIQTGGALPIMGGNIGRTTYSDIFINYQDDGSGDYHLVGGSPAINAGTTGHCAVAPGVSPCEPSLDKDGVVRPQGPAFDIGAYEK